MSRLFLDALPPPGITEVFVLFLNLYTFTLVMVSGDATLEFWHRLPHDQRPDHPYDWHHDWHMADLIIPITASITDPMIGPMTDCMTDAMTDPMNDHIPMGSNKQTFWSWKIPKFSDMF